MTTTTPTTLHAARAAILALASQRDATLPTLDVRTVAAPPDIQAALEAMPERLPEEGMGACEAVGRVMRDVGRGLAAGQAGPRYFGFITGGTLPSAQLADFLTTIYDQNVGSNRPDESIAAVVESRALDFILDLLDLPRDAFPARILTSGATESNVLGLALARDHAIRHALSSTPATQDYSASEHGLGGIALKVYSDRPHASLIKAAAVVGIGRANVVDLGRVLARGAQAVVGIDLEELEGHLEAATPGSGKGAIVSLSFGEVNTGDFTPDARAIRALCDRYGVWLHIDAAFGGYARLVPDLVGPIADHLECADSITLDGHKWLNVPYDCGIFFSRSVAHQTSVFGPSPASGTPAYLMRTAVEEEEGGATREMRAAQEIPDPMTQTVANSRRFRGLPVYTALLDQGRAGYVAVVRRNVEFARRVAAWMEGVEGRGYYEVRNMRRTGSGARTTPLNMVLFRAAGTNPVAGYREEGVGGMRLVRAINSTGKMQVTGGAGGCVRMGVSNWGTGERDYEIVVSVLLGVVEEGLVRGSAI